MWASSGFTPQPPQASMDLAFLHELGAHPNESIGRMILNAKAGTTDSDVRRTWVLFGDPAMKFHFTAAPSTSISDQGPNRPPIPFFPHTCPRRAVCAPENKQ